MMPRRLIAAYADGRTRPAAESVDQEALRTCPNCAAKHDALLALARARPRRGAPLFRTARTPRTRGGDARSDASRGPARSRSIDDRWRWLTGGALAGRGHRARVGSSAQRSSIGARTRTSRPRRVSTHVRATLGNQLIQVASSNQHTVKPGSRHGSDYSPPVRDFAQDGFALTGGRIDYLDRHPVATLVYRVRDHTIDVFVASAVGAGAAVGIAERARLQCRACDRIGDGLARRVRCQRDELSFAFVDRLAREAGNP